MCVCVCVCGVCVRRCVCEAWGVIVWQSLRALVCVRLRLCIRFVSGLWFARCGVTCRPPGFLFEDTRMELSAEQV